MQTSKHIIMRRVYYSFFLSLVTSGAFLQGVVLGGSVALFGRLTHVAAIWQNMLSVPVGRVPEYVVSSVVGALRGGEVFTVLVTGLVIVLSIILLKRILFLVPTFRTA